MAILDNVESTDTAVREAIKKFNQTKSLGPDNIQNRILKELVDYIAKPLDVKRLTSNMLKGCMTPNIQKG